MQNFLEEFSLIKRLPPYIFAIVNDLKTKARARGEDIIDLGMGNPDLPTPKHIVDKLVEAARNPRNHRYSASAGIPKLRLAVCDWYKRNYGVELDPDTEAIVTIGSKEGISHLMLSILAPGDVVIVPNPTYPIHSYSVIIARADVKSVPLTKDINFIEAVEKAVKEIWPRPKVLIISFPHNPTTSVVDLNFFNEIYELARNYGLIVVHDFAYADLCFDGYKAPSFLEVPGAKELGVEFFTLSKSYNMPGWRVGFMVGNAKIINALKRIKSYLDYGIFQPVQIAAILALNGPQDCLTDIRDKYCLRRDKLVDGLSRAGWKITKPKGTMFVWAEIPEGLREMGSLEFSKMLIEKAKVAVSPGVGFGNHGEGYVRFALVENEKRIMQAVRGIRRALNNY
ncbi:MAG TPA: aminotransferase class I/II-fold pyridoxal phosphate-dependent enzyme [Thermodesulfobacteriota bacterium]|nr:aminotransferase class I/II-fold pyridoxal phosphate-dependent enzyme [Thermodesulfobacteriota bacterium]